jgi:site-specific recombinase XerD
MFDMNCSIILALWTSPPEGIHQKSVHAAILKKIIQTTISETGQENFVCSLRSFYNFYLYKTITSSNVGS